MSLTHSLSPPENHDQERVLRRGQPHHPQLPPRSATTASSAPAATSCRSASTAPSRSPPRVVSLGDVIDLTDVPLGELGDHLVPCRRRGPGPTGAAAVPGPRPAPPQLPRTWPSPSPPTARRASSSSSWATWRRAPEAQALAPRGRQPAATASDVPRPT